MPQVIDATLELRRQDCHGLHIRWVGFRTTYHKVRFRLWWETVRSDEPSYHQAHSHPPLLRYHRRVRSWALILVPWHLFWRRREEFRDE